MKKTSFIEDPYVEYDPSLDDYAKNNPNPFPKKMAMAVEFIEKHGLPPHVERTKKRPKPPLTALQTELLTVFSMNPTEKQMEQLKDFLHQLFSKEYAQSETKQEGMAA